MPLNINCKQRHNEHISHIWDCFLKSPLSVPHYTWTQFRVLLCPEKEKSEIDLDACKCSKKWITTYSIAYTIQAVILIISYKEFDNFLYIMHIPMIIFEAMQILQMGSYFLTTNLVCTWFIEATKYVSQVENVNMLVSGSLILVKKMRMIKTGFGPLLTFILINFSVCLVLCTYTGLYYFKKGHYTLCLSFLVSVPSYFLIIYSLICCCDEAFHALSQNNDNLR